MPARAPDAYDYDHAHEYDDGSTKYSRPKKQYELNRTTKYKKKTMPRKKILDNFYEMPEPDEDGIPGVEGVLVKLYPPGDGQYPKQNGQIEDEEGNKAWIVFASEDIFLDSGEWEGKFVKIESKYNDKYKKYTGVKVKETPKGDNLWVTATASIFDEDGDEVPTGNVEKQTRDSGKRPKQRERPSRGSSRREDSGRKSKPEGGGDTVDVFQLTEDICNVTFAAYKSYLTRLEKEDEDADYTEVAAALASGTGSAIAHWWFGQKAPEGIEELRETKKTRKKSRPTKNNEEDEDFEDDDDIPF